MAQTPTADQLGRLVELYIGYFNRAPEADGLNYWSGVLLDLLGQGQTEAQAMATIADQFYDLGIEYEVYDPDMDTEAFIMLAYQNVLGRDLDNEPPENKAEALGWWGPQLEDGSLSKGQFILNLIDAAKAYADDPEWGWVPKYLEARQQAGLLFAQSELGDIADPDEAIAKGQAVLAPISPVTFQQNPDADPAEVARQAFDSWKAEEIGQTFTLTAGADTIFGTAGDDTITGAAGTLNGNDIIIDQTAGDGDVLNVTVQAAQLNAGVPAAVVRGIESINVNIDAITGNAVSYDAENTQGATITLSSERVGFNGVAGVANAGANNVTAGSNVTTLTVTGLTTGVVNTGAATTAVVTTAAATDEANVTVNGNVALTVNTATDVAITGTADAVVTLAGGALADVAVSGPVTLSVTETLANGLDVTGAALVRVTGDDAADVDLSGIAAPIAIVDVQTDNNDVFTVASGASVALLANNDALTLNTARANGTVNVSTAVDQTAVNAGANVTTVNLSVTDEVTIATLNTGAAALNIDVADDLTITTLTSTGDVVITGSGNVVITDPTNVNSIDVSGLAGTLTVATGTQEVTIIGGDQLVDVDLGTENNTAVVIAGSGGSRVNASALNAGETLVLQGGTGTDTLVVEDTADLSAATLTLSSVEVIELAGTANQVDGIDVTFAAAQLSGQAFTVTAEARDDTTVNVVGAQGTTVIDLGGLTLTNIDAFVINAAASTAAVTITGTSTADTITVGNNGSTINAGAGNDVINTSDGRDVVNAGAGDDIINASTGADTFTLGAGNDTVVYTAADQSLTAVDTAADLRASLDVITDWAAGGTNRIDLSALGLTAADFVDQASAQDVVSAFVTANANATLADVFGEIDSNIATDGRLTVFQFGGNTYVYADLDDTGADVTVDDLAIELTGLQSLIEANFVLAP